MSFVMPEIVVQKLLSSGIKKLRADKTAFYDLFWQFTQDEINDDYGPAYLDEVWKWFTTTKIPVVKAWSLNPQVIPCISVHLANETEDESKAAMNDYVGTFNDVAETGTGVFTVMVDIGIHASKSGDHVLWLYYIINYIMFKHKPMAERLGLKLHTFSASDYNKEASKMADNVWTRWIRFRCTTENYWQADELTSVDDINFDPAVDIGPIDDIAVSHDVDVNDVDMTSTNGVIASRVGDEDDTEDVNI